jgi:hypothetical protein
MQGWDEASMQGWDEASKDEAATMKVTSRDTLTFMEASQSADDP